MAEGRPHTSREITGEHEVKDDWKQMDEPAVPESSRRLLGGGMKVYKTGAMVDLMHSASVL